MGILDCGIVDDTLYRVILKIYMSARLSVAIDYL